MKIKAGKYPGSHRQQFTVTVDARELYWLLQVAQMKHDECAKDIAKVHADKRDAADLMNYAFHQEHTETMQKALEFINSKPATNEVFEKEFRL